MFVVVLEFKVDRSEIAPLMPAHSQWLQRAFDDGVFVLTGGIAPGIGGMILAHHLTREELVRRLDEDPLIAQNKVSVAISEVKISRVDERMQFLTGS
jgi:uncharacterized protein YciI